MREIVDPDKAKLIINARPYFSEETTPDSMRVGSVTKVELTQPPQRRIISLEKSP